MLDLNKLEEKLDLALQKETSESLSAWLLKKRDKNAYAYLGDGIIEEISSVKRHGTVAVSISKNTISDPAKAIFYNGESEYLQAA